MTENAESAVIDSLLQPQEEQTATEEETEENDETENAEDEGADLEEADDEEQSEAEQDEEDEEDTEAQEEPDAYEVTVDGETVRVNLQELKNGYSGSRAIQKRMQEAAEKRKEAEAVYSALQEEQQRLTQLYQQYSQQGFKPKPEMPEWDSNDPIGSMERKAAYDRQLEEYNAEQSRLQEMSQQSRQAQEQAMRAHIAEQQQLIAQKIPDYADPEKGKQLRSRMRDVGKSYGFSDDELGGITDARTIEVLHDAMRYRELQLGKTEKRVEKKPKNVRPKPAKRVSAEQKQRQDLLKRVKAGDSSAAAEYLLIPDKET